VALLGLIPIACARTEAPAAPGAAVKVEAARRVMPAVLAGSWYPDDPAELRREIQSYRDQASGELLESVQALILPHAGYRYSGQTAAYGIRQIAGRTFSRVVVIGPSHRAHLGNLGALPTATHFASPLGEVPLDLDFMGRLEASGLFRVIPGVHEQEHSVQIQIPLLQEALGTFVLAPIVLGQPDPATTRRMAQVLREAIDAQTLVLASTDFTHFGPNYGYLPFRENVEGNLRQLDLGAFDFIRNRDPEGFERYCAETGATICGRHPVSLLLEMLPPTSVLHLLHYDTSGRITGDFANSVSYLAIAAAGAWSGGGAANAWAPALSPEDKDRLLRLARDTLTFFYQHGRAPSLDELQLPLTASLQTVCGAFVTLTEHGHLRGCIGDVMPTRPLYQAVMANALNAAMRDPRFRPVEARELPLISMEISVLTPPHPVSSFREIELGRHGVVLNKAGRTALFLPQVAPEQHWTLDETLDHLSLKAGLPADAWKEGAQFNVFEAIVFGEGDV